MCDRLNVCLGGLEGSMPKFCRDAEATTTPGGERLRPRCSKIEGEPIAGCDTLAIHALPTTVSHLIKSRSYRDAHIAGGRMTLRRQNILTSIKRGALLQRRHPPARCRQRSTLVRASASAAASAAASDHRPPQVAAAAALPSVARAITRRDPPQKNRFQVRRLALLHGRDPQELHSGTSTLSHIGREGAAYCRRRAFRETVAAEESLCSTKINSFLVHRPTSMPHETHIRTASLGGLWIDWGVVGCFRGRWPRRRIGVGDGGGAIAGASSCKS